MPPPPDLPGVQHHYVQAGEVRLHYALAGPPDGEPVVLVHGWPQHFYAWRKVIPLLTGRFRVMAVDLRGFGWSDAPPTTYRKEELAGDVTAFLDTLELEDVRLAGHDWGGFACLLAAARAPRRLRSVVGFAIPAPWSTGRPSPAAVATALAYQPLLAAPFLGRAAQRFTPIVDLVLRAGARLWDPARAEAASRVYRSYLLHEVGRPYRGPRLEVPGRLVLGRSDVVVTPGLAEGAGIDVEVVDGGHFLPEEQPAIVAERIAA